MSASAIQTPDRPPEAAWLSYAENVIPPNASQIQRIECRRAFYAGATGFWSSVAKFMDGDGDEPTEADEALLEGMVRELHEFHEKLKAGNV